MKNFKKLEELKERHNLDSDFLCQVICAYADTVDHFLNTKSLPGTLPKSFEAFLNDLDLALQNQDSQEEKKAPSNNVICIQIPSDIEQTELKEVNIEASIMPLLMDKEATLDEAADEKNKIKVAEAEYEIDPSFAAFSEHIGKDYSSKFIKVLFERIYEINDEYAVKISICAAAKVFVMSELLDCQRKSCCRLKPRYDKIEGTYAFNWNNTKIVLRLIQSPE